MDILALNPQTSPKNEQKKKRKAYLKMISPNKIDQNSAKHLSSSLPPSLSVFLSELSKYLLCSTSQLPPQKLSLRKMKNPLQEAPCPKLTKKLSRISHSRQWDPPSSCSLLLSLLRTLLKNISSRPGKRNQAAGHPAPLTVCSFSADSLDTCRPMVGHQKHHSGAPTANQRLTRGHPRWPHLSKMAA